LKSNSELRTNKPKEKFDTPHGIVYNGYRDTLTTHPETNKVSFLYIEVRNEIVIPPDIYRGFNLVYTRFFILSHPISGLGSGKG
jgi:hypothetical protein